MKIKILKNLVIKFTIYILFLSYTMYLNKITINKYANNKLFYYNHTKYIEIISRDIVNLKNLNQDIKTLVIIFLMYIKNKIFFIKLHNKNYSINCLKIKIKKLLSLSIRLLKLNSNLDYNLNNIKAKYYNINDILFYVINKFKKLVMLIFAVVNKLKKNEYRMEYNIISNYNKSNDKFDYYNKFSINYEMGKNFKNNETITNISNKINIIYQYINNKFLNFKNKLLDNKSFYLNVKRNFTNLRRNSKYNSNKLISNNTISYTVNNKMLEYYKKKQIYYQFN